MTVDSNAMFLIKILKIVSGACARTPCTLFLHVLFFHFILIRLLLLKENYFHDGEYRESVYESNKKLL